MDTHSLKLLQPILFSLTPLIALTHPLSLVCPYSSSIHQNLQGLPPPSSLVSLPPPATIFSTGIFLKQGKFRESPHTSPFSHLWNPSMILVGNLIVGGWVFHPKFLLMICYHWDLFLLFSVEYGEKGWLFLSSCMMTIFKRKHEKGCEILKSTLSLNF